MCFDGKNNHLKKNKRKYSNSNNKRMWKVLKIEISFWVMMKYSFFIHWLIRILVVIVVGPHY